MLTLQVPARNAAVDGVTGLIDAAGGAGSLQIKSAAGIVLCVVELDDPAFSPAEDGTATALGLPKQGIGTAAAGEGTKATKYDVCDSSGRVVWSGDVPGNLMLDNTSIAAKQVVHVVSWSHTQPAS
jgi:hypothetical protein